MCGKLETSQGRKVIIFKNKSKKAILWSSLVTQVSIWWADGLTDGQVIRKKWPTGGLPSEKNLITTMFPQAKNDGLVFTKKPNNYWLK